MTEKQNKIIILIPGEQARGGITNYYYSIRPELPEQILYFQRGSRTWPNRSGKLKELLRMLMDYWNFIRLIAKKDVVMIQTTTAFYGNSIYRDGLFLRLARIFGKKTVVFFRGWDDAFVANLSGFKKKIVEKDFFKADAIIDLSVQNVEKLKAMGYQRKLYLETTLVDKMLVQDINIDAVISARLAKPRKTILFLSRMEKAKGVHVLLQAFEELKKEHPEFDLIFAGDGSATETLQNEIQKRKIKDVHFTGFVSGQQKKALFLEANIFVFLSEFEGMPNAVLEAMSFGLPVVTTNVGGIASVFEDEKNGKLLESSEIQSVIDAILKLTSDAEAYTSRGKINYTESREKFWSDAVAKRMRNIFSEVLEKEI